MWYVERYQPDRKKPYLLAHLENFADLRKMVANRRCDRIEIVAPMDARAIDIKKLRSLGAVHIQISRPRQNLASKESTRGRGRVIWTNAVPRRADLI
jgi:hypothetical protein